MNKKVISVIPLLILTGAIVVVGYFLVVAPPATTSTLVAQVNTPVVAAEFTATPTSPPSATPTTTPLPVSTDTPSPTLTETATEIPSATATSTGTPTPTEPPPTTPTSPPAPVSPTVMPSPSPVISPTPIFTPSPAPPPAPPADAVITLDNGFVSLRRGPSSDYEVVGTLRKGDQLEIRQRLFDNGDWLKVSVNSDSGEGVTGWVTTDPAVVDINVDLADVPQMYEFGPHLLVPRPFESRGVDGLIEFEWAAAPYPLADHQYYSLLLVRDDQSDAEACFHWQTRETKLSLTPEEEGCTAGAYGWRVGIATDLNGGVGERDWRDDTEFDEKNPIGIGIPHPGKPSDGGGGGDNPSGGIAPDP